jgi:3-hydroxyacyl-[acyl-carrier-protein] dehydratase
MLLNDFFSVLSSAEIDGGFCAEVKINASHEIFSGHFPGNPVVPGVCLIQMIRETARFYLKKSLRMVKATEIKFINIVNPLQNSDLLIELNIREMNEAGMNVSALIKKDETIFLKIKAQYLFETI